MKDKIIVIFSTNLSKKDNEDFTLHIKNTIGISNYVIKYYNNNNEFSLTEIYNKGIEENYQENSIFVFCHNDIIFKTLNWGKILLRKFNYNNDYQILGVAGSTYLSENGVWWDNVNTMHGIVEHTNGLSTWISEFSNEKKGMIVPTVLIDGVFMAVDCDNIEERFNENYKGFHFYDISFSVSNYLKGCNIGVINDIRILHKSIGRVNELWELNRQQFITEYKDELPINLEI